MEATPDSHNEPLEQALLGNWKSITHPPGKAEEFTFKPGHAFTGRIQQGDGDCGVYGYWDVIGNQLRMGPTVDSVDKVQMHLEGDEVLMTTPNGKAHRWLRKI